MTEWNGKVTVDSKEWRIDWVHYRWDNKDREVIQRTPKASTYCNICEDGKWLTGSAGDGEAYCSWSDNFSRRVGRKLSLQRALLNSDFTRAQRKQVWDQVLAIKGLVK